MMDNATQDIEHHIARLHSNGRLRVWSLIISFFGDAVALRGGRVGLPVLQDAMTLLKIEHGAVRTAVSRLAKDGWVVREREGRLSFYELSPQGRFAFDEATRRIYAAGPPPWDGTWTIAITQANHDETLFARGFVSLGGPAWIKAGHGASEQLAETLLIHGSGTDFPPALSQLWGIDDLATYFANFISSWSGFKAEQLSPAHAMAARTLLIHDWRRIVLRDPDLPAALLPDGWPGLKALALVRRIYAGLAAQSEQWLDEAGLPPARDTGKLMARFITLRSIAN